jgi:hypothetical protein
VEIGSPADGEASCAVGEARVADEVLGADRTATGDATSGALIVAIGLDTDGRGIVVGTTLATLVIAGGLRKARGTAPLGGVKKYRYDTTIAEMIPNEAKPTYISFDGCGVSGESPGGSGVKFVTIEVHHSKVGGRRKLYSNREIG